MLNDSSNEECKFAKKWYVIDSQTVNDKHNKINSIKFETESAKSNLCDYSNAYILVTGDITLNTGNVNGKNTDIAFKSDAHFQHADRN